MVGCFFSLNKRPQRVRGGMEPSTKQEMTVCFRCRVVCLSECLKWRQIHLKQGRLLHSGLSLCSSVRTVSSLLSSSDETFLGATCSPLVEFCCCSVTKVLQGSVKMLRCAAHLCLMFSDQFEASYKFTIWLNIKRTFKGTVCNDLSNLLTQINVFIHK